MSTSPSAGSSPSLEAHNKLIDWVRSHGGSISDSVQVSQDSTRGVHLQVKADWPDPIPKETRVISTPVGITLSYFNAIDHQHQSSSNEILFSSDGLVFPRAFIDAVGREETTIFFLMGQFLRGESSFWFPYLRTLPQPGQLTTPLFFGEEDVDWIQGTGIPDASVQRFRLWEGRFDASIAKLEEVEFENVDSYTWELYLWASTIISSRAFSSKVLAGAVPDGNLSDGDGVSVLLPLVDLPNHRPLAKVEWRAGEEDVGLLVLEEIAPGQEIFNNYGPRNNEQLLMNYGFCLANNPTDYRIVKLGVLDNSPLTEAKDRQRQLYPELATTTEEPYYIFSILYPLLARDTPMEHTIVSPALFNALTVMEGNPREHAMIEITESEIRIPPAYGTGHSTLAALSQISFELIAHIALLKDSAEGLSAQPANLNQMHTQIYRNGQIALDQAALIIISWTLTRAREQQRGETWDDIKTLLNEHMARIPADLLPEEILSRIRVRILERESIVPKNGVLFRLTELFTLLPTEMQCPSQQHFNHVFDRAAQVIPVVRSVPNLLFGTLLCLLVATYRSQAPLSARLTRWLEFLFEAYPPPSVAGHDLAVDEEVDTLLAAFDEFVNVEDAPRWAADDGVTWLVNDSGWLDVNWLRWAWWVAEAETVLVPPEPLQILGGGPVQMLKQACLYVP
ncbi:hypothetical protein N7474_006933 [Penicillium riverlandense]|uniref:uncharacterized protein n=1 Tax=Penicillium riverlandense TaxID=1903569 RepID=UPI0025485A55|nr:uncharacterized protein N7474_006933 [Penicillium riverlandense]KAJ5815156.1 hypothetical protein N7474_006933 [Penicillium riverlandense]